MVYSGELTDITPMLMLITNMLATSTPAAMLKNDGQKRRFRKDAASAPVQAPVPGKGKETNSNRPSHPQRCIFG